MIKKFRILMKIKKNNFSIGCDFSNGRDLTALAYVRKSRNGKYAVFTLILEPHKKFPDAIGVIMANRNRHHLPSKKIIQNLRSRGLIVERGFIDGKRCWIVKNKRGGQEETEKRHIEIRNSIGG